MTEVSPPRVRPLRDRKALLVRQEKLAAEATTIDVEQRRLAVELGRIRKELSELREQLWPSEDGHAFAKERRPPLAGPTLVPPPLPDALPVRGRALRDAALRALLRADQPMTLGEIHRALHLGGHVMLAANPVKRLGDALGYEERRGVVRRIARGTYVLAHLTPYRRRVLERSTTWG
jgi:hypothetical protein